jgi:hypothetical protein
MEKVKQSTGNNCFVACAASALLDEGDSKLKALIGAEPIGKFLDTNCEKLQQLIIDTFPDKLQKGSGKEGAPRTVEDMESVLKGLKLATSVAYNPVESKAVVHFLKENKGNVRWSFIGVAPINTHVVRLRSIEEEGICIMDPTDGDYHFWDWERFLHEYRSLLILNTY